MHKVNAFTRFGNLPGLVASLLLVLQAKPLLAESAPQPETPPADQSTKVEVRGKRIPSSFFEKERKLRRFGFDTTEFLDSALNGADLGFNAVADPISVTVRVPNSSFALQPITPTTPTTPTTSSLVTEGIITIGNRDSDSPNFLQGTGFTSTSQNVSVLQTTPGVTFQNGVATFTYNGQTFVGRYSGSGSKKGDVFSGSILLVNSQNPSQSILLQLSPTSIPGAADLPDSVPISAPGTISVGRPIDR